MRQYIDIVVEARRPTITRDREGVTNFDFMPELERGAVAPAGPARNVGMPGRQAGRRPRQRAVDVDAATMTTASQHLSSLGQHDMQDEISDDEALRRSGLGDVHNDVGHEPVEPNLENLPAVIRQEVAQTGGHVDPEWHQVKHLPGYFQQGIRALGRSVFRQFTDTPIEDIQVLTTLGNINPEQEVVGMMQWIRRNGARDDAAGIDFDQIMPGYNADVSYWRTRDYSFLLVHDFAGYYVYGWQGGRGVHIAPPAERKRLR